MLHLWKTWVWSLQYGLSNTTRYKIRNEQTKWILGMCLTAHGGRSGLDNGKSHSLHSCSWLLQPRLFPAPGWGWESLFDGTPTSNLQLQLNSSLNSSLPLAQFCTAVSAPDFQFSAPALSFKLHPRIPTYHHTMPPLLKQHLSHNIPSQCLERESHFFSETGVKRSTVLPLLCPLTEASQGPREPPIWGLLCKGGSV